MYNREENGEMGEDADTSNSLSRSLTVLGVYIPQALKALVLCSLAFKTAAPLPTV